MDIVLDGKFITNKNTLFEELKKQINDEAFYGDNLDALWDVLSYSNKEINVVIVNQVDLKNHLGDYADILIEVLNNLKDVNERTSVEIK